ncbi:MAG: hypothetical protein EON55_05535 [Alphaproteobacteria bacterium]|nr:MAG: hypothetical protein EON55_05535 [Alphaproteobacteria bacterium]
MPAVIVVSTAGSLVGAGSHLVANDILHRASGDRIGFGRWALYGLPFAVAMSAATCWVVEHMFLDGDLRRRELVLETDAPARLTGPEWRTIAVTAAMIALWVTEGLHPFGIALVALLGGFVLTTPKLGVMSWKKGIKSVKWNLILFVGAALVLSGALVDTGAADWLIRRMIDFSGLSSAEAPIVVLAALLAMSLTAHLYFTSHTARVAALLPPLLVLARSLDLQAPAVAFIVTVGMDYCLTFPVSSKALLLFGGAEDAAWTPKDLLKLTAVLLPLYALLMVAFYYGYWRPLGLSL